MTKTDQTVLIAKIDTLYYSTNDPLIQSVITLLRDTVSSLEPSDSNELGFNGKISSSEQNDVQVEPV